MNWKDAAELVLAGASAVGMGTAMFVDPALPGRVAHDLQGWVTRQRCESITELVGQVKWP
jgi:dihydroorotate dehydrogenase (NAD+) catalytic subunit